MKNFDSKITKILKKYPVIFAYVFGSQAKRKTGPMSDIDIAMFFNSYEAGAIGRWLDWQWYDDQYDQAIIKGFGKPITGYKIYG